MKINITFNIPDLNDRVPWQGGIAVGTKISGSLPNIFGFIAFHHGDTYGIVESCGGAFETYTKVPKYSIGTGQSSDNAYGSVMFDASTYCSSYGRFANNKVIPEGIQMYYFVKY